MVEGHDVARHESSVVCDEFPHLEEGGIVPASGDFADTRVATKGRSDANRCGRELASFLVGEEAGKERKAVVGATEDGQKICAFYAREQRPDGGYLFMNANGFCNYAYMDKFGRIDRKG